MILYLSVLITLPKDGYHGPQVLPPTLQDMDIVKFLDPDQMKFNELRLLSNSDFDIVMSVAESHPQLKMLKLHRNNSGRIVALKLLSEGTSQTGDAFTEADLGVIRIRQTITIVGEQVSALEGRIANEDKDMKTAAKSSSGKKSRALFHLKRKKLLQSVLQQRLDHFHNLEGVLQSIATAETNTRVAEAYKLGTAAIKSLNIKLQGQVDDVVDDVREALADQAEIDTMLSSISTSTEMDDEEVEAELNQLLAAEQATVASQESKRADSLVEALESLT
ncbi:hypothetical protein HDU76_010538, partial [Blyttiomyces sp. JEL0837]